MALVRGSTKEAGGRCPGSDLQEMELMPMKDDNVFVSANNAVLG